MDGQAGRRARRRVQFGKVIEDDFYEIFLFAFRNDNKFGDIPSRYNSAVARTLKDNLLIAAGRQNELKPLNRVETLCVRGFQRAENDYIEELRIERESQYKS